MLNACDAITGPGGPVLRTGFYIQRGPVRTPKLDTREGASRSGYRDRSAIDRDRPAAGRVLCQQHNRSTPRGETGDGERTVGGQRPGKVCIRLRGKRQRVGRSLDFPPAMTVALIRAESYSVRPSRVKRPQ